MVKRLVLLALLVLLAVFEPASAGAQAPAGLEQPGAAPAQVPAAEAQGLEPAPVVDDSWIRPEDIGERADALTQRLDDRRATAGEIAELRKIETGLTRLQVELDAALAQAKAALTDSTSLIIVQDARRELESVSRPLSDWMESLTANARRASEVIEEASTAQKRWVETRRRPETAEAGEAIVRRVDSSLALIRQFVAEMHAWRVQVLAVNNRLLDRSAAVNDAIRKLENAAAAQSAVLIVPDQPPLWQRGLLSKVAREFQQVPRHLQEFRQSTTEYFQLDARPFLLQAFLAVVLMLLLRGLPQNAQHRIEQAHVAPETARLLTRPYSIVLLLAMVASPVLHPTAPQRVVQLLALLALFPVARILMLAHGRADFSLFAGLFAMLVIDRTSIALSALPALVLISFVAQLCVALPVALAYRRRVVASGGSAWLVRVLDAAVCGLGVALIAQVGGWSSLAAILGRGILAGTIAGLYLYAAIISLEALIAYALATPAMRRSRFVDRNQSLLHRWTILTVRTVGVVYWIRLVLNSLGVRDAAHDAVRAFLASGVSIGELSISLGGILAFVLTLVFARMFSRVLHEVLEDEVFPRANFPRGIPNALLTLTRYAIYSLGFILALAAAGVQLGQLTILIGGLGVGIGLGLQDLVKNFAAGITLLLERRVHVGDVVQIPEKNVFGRVISIGMRASVVRNWNGSEVVLPNDDLVSGSVTNLTLSDRMTRVEVTVGVAYGTDPATVLALLLGVAQADPRLLRVPEPSAVFQGFGESSLDFVLRAWTDEEYETVGMRRSDLAVAVHAALREAGIAIPFPQRDVNLMRMSPQVGEVLKEARRPD